LQHTRYKGQTGKTIPGFGKDGLYLQNTAGFIQAPATFESLKLMYTILFFLGLLLLIALSFLVLKMMDEGAGGLKLIALFFAILLCIISLIIFLRQYLKVQSSGPPKEF
jgi:phosphoglycerol transferase MdoB-like AlkP superfamily enzyme